MPGDKCILQLRGLPPFFSPKYDLKRHPNYRYTAEADKQKNAFDLDRLINRRRRPGLNEVCTMYEVAVPDDALTEEDEDILNYDDIDDPDAFCIKWGFGTKCPEVRRRKEGGKLNMKHFRMLAAGLCSDRSFMRLCDSGLCLFGQWK